MKRHSVFLAAVVVVCSPLAVQSAEVEVKGVHMCCGQCVKIIAKTLGKVEGVSDAACDRKAKTIKFKADDAKVAKKALRRLTNAGFFGKAAIDGKAAKLPASGAKKDQKSDSIAIRNVHLCCGLCVKAVTKALKAVEGVEGVAPNRKKNTVQLIGKQFDVTAAIAALNKAGFNGRVGKRKKEK